jgi:SNF2 family DNA or RNA helicase
MPWWEFLSCREAIGYYVARNNVEIEFEPAAEQLLERAEKNSRAFTEGHRQEPIPEDELQPKLRERGFTRELTNEQRRNVGKLTSLAAGATFSVPGAGKTTEALALFFLNASEQARLLVIAPKNAFAAWESELNLCAPGFPSKFERLVGGESQILQILTTKSPKFMLVTYHQLQFARDAIASDLTENTWIFLDESHRIKRGLGGKIGNTVLSLSHIPDFKLLLSGTPMPNSDSDLVPQFEFLFPETKASAEQVTKLIQPFYVRTTKHELGLKTPDRRLISVPMTEAQYKLYKLASSETAREAALALKDRSRFRALGRSVMRLLQLTSNPALLARSFDFPADLLSEILVDDDSPKIKMACEYARQLAKAKKKVVIWSTFVGNVELISRRLADLGADFIHGGVDAGSEEEEDTREWKIRKFHEPDKNWVLVANPASCGEGISLHEICHHAIYVDRNYNAAQYIQSEDRIHRLGLPKGQSTTVDILSCPGTIDGSVNERLVAKVRRMSDVLNDPHLQIDPVSFDPAAIDDDESLDLEDVSSLIRHLHKATEDA